MLIILLWYFPDWLVIGKMIDQRRVELETIILATQMLCLVHTDTTTTSIGPITSLAQTTIEHAPVNEIHSAGTGAAVLLSSGKSTIRFV